MKRFLFLILSLVFLVGVPFAQITDTKSIPIEIAIGPTGTNIIRPLFRPDSRDSTVFNLSKVLDGAGDTAWVTSALYHADWDRISFTMIATGDSVQTRAIFFFGYAEDSVLSNNQTVADTSKMHFIPKDTLTMAAAGTYLHEISSPVLTKYLYVLFRADSLNGSNTSIRGYIHRRRR